MSVIRFQRSLAEGSCIFLVFLPCIDFILTFLGCIRAGLVAVPVYPPSTYHRLHHNQTLRKSKRTFSCFLESSKTVKPKSRYVTSFLSLFFIHCSEYMKIKRVTDMKALFTASGVQWPDLEWINLSSILETSSLPDVPSGFPLILLLITQTSRLSTSPATISASSNTLRAAHRFPKAS